MEKEYLKVTENLHEDEARLIESVASGSKKTLPFWYHDKQSLIKAVKSWLSIVTR